MSGAGRQYGKPGAVAPGRFHSAADHVPPSPADGPPVVRVFIPGDDVYTAPFPTESSPLRLYPVFLLLLAIQPRAEPLQVYDDADPPWLAAVGRLSVPGHRFDETGEKLHHREDCSATLIAPNLILSAWHCLEHYRDLSREITFTLPHSGATVVRTARRVASGGGMRADWALLRLDSGVLSVQPARVAAEFAPAKGAEIGLAGYSGGLSAPLKWRADCRVTAVEAHRVGVDCPARKGASGGPVFKDGLVLGVVSAGDGETITYYAPSTLFDATLRRHRR